MSNKQTAIAANAQAVAKRTATGQWAPGVSGRTGYDAARARHTLNRDTIMEMQAAFNEGGAGLIRKVMTSNPALFLKLLVMLVPKELQVTHSGGVKSMSDEQLQACLEYLEAQVALKAAGEGAKVIEGKVEVSGESGDSPGTPDIPTRTRKRKAQRTGTQSMGMDMGSEPVIPE